MLSPVAPLIRLRALPIFSVFALLLSALLSSCADEPPADDGTADLLRSDAAVDHGTDQSDVSTSPDRADESDTDEDRRVEDTVADAREPANRDRVVLIGHTFTAEPGVPGTEIRSLLFTTDAQLLDQGIRLDVGTRPARIAFLPDQEYALVLGEDGTLVSVQVTAVDQMSVVDQVSLPSAQYGDIRIPSEGDVAFVVGSDVAATSGVSVVAIDPDGTLRVKPELFLNIRLAQSMAFLPDQRAAVLLGGQAVFEPIDDDDLRWLERSDSDGWSGTASFDIWSDHVDCGRIALSPDGATLLVPNGSPFSTEGARVLVANVTDRAVTVDRWITAAEDAREAVFLPNGETALVSLFEPGQVVVLTDRGTGWENVAQVGGIGLADQMAVVTRGDLTGTVLLPSIDPSGGPNVAMLRVTGPSEVTDLGQLELGSGSVNIPETIAIQN